MESVSDLEVKTINANVSVVEAIDAVNEKEWDSIFSYSTGLKYHVLKLFEDSGVNELRHHYVSLKRDGRFIGKANVYETEMDFTSMDSSMPPSIKAMVKEWHPNFLRLSMVECGLFAMNGDGFVCKSEGQDEAISQTAQYMEEVAKDREQELVVFRDVPFEQYNSFEKVLKPKGYLPCAGFTNAVVDIEWESIEDYLASVNSKTRHKLKHAIKIEEKFEITVEIRSDFEQYAERMAELWGNVSDSSEDYSREILNERFFALSSKYKAANTEAIMFFKDEKLLAFMWNIVGEQDYHMADWGVDYSYEFYREANFYRAASMFSLKRAIALGKKRMQLGMTNYVPKKLLGAQMQPLVYFIKHVKDNSLTSCVCRLITNAIEQPDTLSYYASNTVTETEISGEAYKCLFDKKARHYQDGVLAHISDNYETDMLRLGGVSPYYFQGAETQKISSDNAKLDVADIGLEVKPNRIFNSQSENLKKLELAVSNLYRKESTFIVGDATSHILALGDVILCGAKAVYISDNSAPQLFDTLSLFKSEVHVFKNNDSESLSALLEGADDHRHSAVIIESIDSVHGNKANLRSFAELKEKYQFLLCVDESNALGVVGEAGLGACVSENIVDSVDIVMASFVSALALNASFIASQKVLLDYMSHSSQYLSSGASVEKSKIDSILNRLLELPHGNSSFVDLRKNKISLLNILEKSEINVIDGGGPYVNIPVGSFMVCVFALSHLQSKGLFVDIVGPPIVEDEDSMLKIRLSAELTEVEVTEIANVLVETMHRIVSAFSSLSS